MNDLIMSNQPDHTITDPFPDYIRNIIYVIIDLIQATYSFNENEKK